MFVGDLWQFSQVKSLVGVHYENNTTEEEIFCDMQNKIIKPIQKNSYEENIYKHNN